MEGSFFRQAYRVLYFDYVLNLIEYRKEQKEVIDLQAEGHSLHCAQRQVWGDGECECLR